jgi:rubrerythrin
MDMTKQALDVMEALAENEMLISRLYRTFAERFPDDREFWETMAAEETQHADMIRSLAQEVKEGAVAFNSDGFDNTAVGMFHDYLKFSLARAQEEEMLPEGAFETALAIEHDLVERSFFGWFEAKTPEMSLILEGLTSSTRAHHRRLVQALEESRQSH